MVRRSLVMLCLFMFTLQISAKNKESSNNSSKISVKQYIQKWGPVARKHMMHFGIPASIILAQGILESGYGNSRMAQQANNHFGIKCLGWNGDSYYQINDENGCYRKYSDTEDSYRDHARILSNKARYSFLFKLDPRDYKSWAWGLKQAGYAEDKQYAKLLIKMIENYKLYQFDKVAANGNLAIRKFSYSTVAESTGVKRLAGMNIRKLIFKKRETVDRTAQELTKIETGVAVVANEPAVAELKNSLVSDHTGNIPKWVSGLDDMLLSPGLTLPRTTVKYVIADKYDSYREIAEENGLSLEQILQYNDLDQAGLVMENQIVYIAPKSSEATEAEHRLRKNQTLWEVSQLYGVKLERLLKLNKVRPGQELPENTLVMLK